MPGYRGMFKTLIEWSALLRSQGRRPDVETGIVTHDDVEIRATGAVARQASERLVVEAFENLGPMPPLRADVELSPTWEESARRAAKPINFGTPWGASEEERRALHVKIGMALLDIAEERYLDLLYTHAFEIPLELGGEGG